MSGYLFPSLLPKISDPVWFNVDKPCDDENELAKLEEEHQNWLAAIAEKDGTITPIGKSAAEHTGEDDDDEEDDEADVDEDSDTNDDDELDTDMIDDRDSPDEIQDMDANDPNTESPSWGL